MRRLKPVVFYGAQALVVAVALVLVLRLWEQRLEVPLGYDSDALFYTALVKATAEDGTTHLRHLGMPFGVDIVDWPQATPFDFTVMRLLFAVSGTPGIAINLYWLLSVVGTGVTATFALRCLGLEPSLAFGLGYLYALSPCAFNRNVHHITLVFHFVPLIALLALTLATGEPERLRRGGRVAVLAACLLQGLSYAYYSFFSCVLLVAAGALGWLRTRRADVVQLAAAGLVVITIATGTSLAPSVLYWRAHGVNAELQYKYASQADVYGLKIRDLLVPIPDHPLAAFRAVAARVKEAHFPADNENTIGKLCTLGSLGFLILLAVSLGSASGAFRGGWAEFGGPAALTLVALLVAQIGGFGSLFSLFVSPDIRAYNRIVVFIAFFSLFALGLALARLQAAVLARGWAPPALLRGGVLGLLLVAVVDQASTTGILQARAGYGSRYDLDREFVARVESQLPKGALVFQLPHTIVPIEDVPTHMSTYAHAHAYLHSRSLRWSWGAIAGRNGGWQREVQRLPARSLVKTLAMAGFSGIWIDRFGYEYDLQPSSDFKPRPNPEAALAHAVGVSPETSLDQRYAFLSIEAIRQSLISDFGPDGYARAREEVLRPPLVPRFIEGFGEEDGDATQPWRWCGARGRIVIKNVVDRERDVLVTARLRCPGPQPQPVEVQAGSFTDKLMATQEGIVLRRAASIPGQRRLNIRFSCPDRPVSPRAEERCFQLLDFQATDQKPADFTATVAEQKDEEE
jgi:hypothetical protein